MKPKPGDIVAVHWIDAVVRDTGQKGDTFKPLSAITYGLLIEDEKDRVVVAAEEFVEDDLLRQITTVPRAMVSRVVVLSRP